MPNTKSKKFDFSILLASLSIVLVICCAVICCVIGIGTDNQVAQAYTDEEVGRFNLEFTVDDGFYIHDLYSFNVYEVERLINYLFYYIPGVMDSEVEFWHSYQVGYLDIYYTLSNGSSVHQTQPIYLELSQSDGLISISVLMSANSDMYFFDFTYNFTEKYIDDFYLSITATQDDIYHPYAYYVSLAGHPDIEGSFANELGSLLFEDLQFVYSFDSLGFYFYNIANLGFVFSPDIYFAIPPVVIPENVLNVLLNNSYDLGYEDGIAEGGHNQELIEQLREELAYYRSLDLNYQEIQVFNIARCKPSTFVYDGVTYTSNSIVRTNDGWDVYSSTYLNEQLPENYGVGFSLFLEETIINSKFHIYPDILSWYNYTYCSPPAQDGSQECYQVNERNINFSVGYRTQNGNIVKIGEFSNAPGMTTGNFVINQPTNEIVFFREESNLMQIGNLFSLITYQFDTESIYNDGYENGKTQGIQIGRQEGYNQGVLDANDYSFFSLFTSVFDAPISAIVGKWGDSDGDGVYAREGGMLNFYIPGLDINFAPFLLSLFTIAIIVLVIRFIMARKS